MKWREREIGGDVEGVGAESFVDRVRGGVDRPDERRHLEGRVGGQVASRAQSVQGPEHALVGDEQAPHAELGRAQGVFDTAGEGVVARARRPAPPESVRVEAPVSQVPRGPVNRQSSMSRSAQAPPSR